MPNQKLCNICSSCLCKCRGCKGTGVCGDVDGCGWEDERMSCSCFPDGHIHTPAEVKESVRILLGEQ